MSGPEAPLRLVRDDESLVAHSLAPGTILFERYRVQALLSEGSVATVYRAQDIVSETPVALKVFDPLRRGDEVAVQRFKREFEALSKIDHPGVARALRFEEDTALDVLVMEWVEGESLADALEEGPLPVRRATDLIRRIARILNECHRKGVVHRDLKPSNIMLHAERGPVVLDFGAAWFSSAMTLTRTGAIIGSPRYLAPEMFEGSHVDPRADVYALGTILFEMVTGRYARDVETVAELAARTPTPPPPVSTICSQWPRNLDCVVERALAERPEDRFTTVLEFEEALASGSIKVGRALEPNLRCDTCGTPLIIDLPICPGCGTSMDWALEPGDLAVQIVSVESPDRVVAWLRNRYGDLVGFGARVLHQRLKRPPLVLAAGISERSAEALASQAKDAGCRVAIVRGRRVLGPALSVPSATPGEILVALGAHATAVIGVGALLVLAGAPTMLTAALPALFAALGIPWAVRHVRRPLLITESGEEALGQDNRLEQLKRVLAQLDTVRARSIAATAIAKAAPLLIDQSNEQSQLRTRSLETLETALEAVVEVDLHARALRAKDLPKPERLDISIAHDHAVRRALAEISDIETA